MSRVISLLFGENGQYSDRCEWVVRGYTKRADADADCAALNAIVDTLDDLVGADASGIAFDNAVRARLIPHDANAVTDYWSRTAYSVTDVPLVSAPQVGAGGGDEKV